MRACLLYNPRAEVSDRIAELVRAMGSAHRCELRPTTCSGDAAKLAREAVEDGFDRLIVAGGDGLVSQAINGIAPDFDALEMAILPLGTGNDLSRALGLSLDQLEIACRDALGDHLVPIDVIRLAGQRVSYCVNVANGGFGGRVAIDVQSDDKRRWGPIAYWMSSLAHLADLDNYQLSLTLDDQQLDTTVMGIAIANGRFIGGGFPIAPNASLNDGLMDVVTVPVLPALELMSVGLGFTMGQQDERVKSYQVRHLKLDATPAIPFSIDGEPAEELHADFEVLPQVLKVAVGEEAPGLTSANRQQAQSVIPSDLPHAAR